MSSQGAQVAGDVRHRRRDPVEFGRIVGLSDGVFAIAITLLVLNLDIPTSDLVDSLRDESNSFLAYALSFAVLGRFWMAHHAFFSEVKRFDRGLMRLNLVFLGWVTLVPFATGVFGEFSGEPAGIAVYAVVLAALGITEDLLAVYASHKGLTSPEFATRERTTEVLRFLVPVIFLAAIPVAVVAPGLAPLVWLLIIPVGRVRGRREGTRPQAKSAA